MRKSPPAINLEEASRFRSSLLELVSCGPGAHPAFRREAGRLLLPWQTHPDQTVCRRTMDVCKAFEDWFSARRWNHGEDGGKAARQRLVNTIERLHLALIDFIEPVKPSAHDEPAGERL